MFKEIFNGLLNLPLERYRKRPDYRYKPPGYPGIAFLITIV